MNLHILLILFFISQTIIKTKDGIFASRRLRKSHLAGNRRKSENILIFFLLSIPYIFFGIIRKILYTLYFYVNVTDSPLLNFSSRLRYFLNADTTFDSNVYIIVKLLFYVVDMLLSQLLWRRICLQLEHGEEGNNWMDKVWIKISKKFFHKLIRMPVNREIQWYL